MEIQISSVHGAVPISEAVKVVRARGRKCSHLSLWRWVRANGVPVYRVANRLLVPIDALVNYRHGDER